MGNSEYRQTGRPKPILVTGAPRSGTTWVGRMLALSPALYYIHEPFNPHAHISKAICKAAPFPFRNMYITEENEQQYYRAIKEILEGHYSLVRGLAQARSYRELRNAVGLWRKMGNYRERGITPLIKDPTALMSAGWLARRFDIQVVVVLRHPAAFVNSMKNRNWPFYPSRWALPQSLLMRDYLGHFEKEMIELEQGQADIVDRTALLWKLFHHVIAEYKKAYPGWVFLRHEDIATNPLATFGSLYDRLGLVFSDDVRQSLSDFSKETNPAEGTGSVHFIQRNSSATVSDWKRSLTPSDIARIRERVEPVASNFYDDSDWS